jgi:hypothetical protein
MEDTLCDRQSHHTTRVRIAGWSTCQDTIEAFRPLETSYLT